MVCYGYIQSFIGFIAGLLLARITHVESKNTEPLVDEEVMLLMENTN